VPTTADRRRTLADLIDKYLGEPLPLRPNLASAKGQRRMLAWWVEDSGYLTIDKLTPAAIAEARARLLLRTTRSGTRVTAATVNRYLAALSAVCKWAWRELQWLQSNPVLSVTKGPESTGVVRWLSDDERKRLLDACRASDDPNIHCGVMLALATGARYGNLRMLRWEHVDLERMVLMFPMTKNGTARAVPVVGPAQAVLRAHRERDPTGQGWVFKGRKDAAPASLDKPWRVVRAAAGLDDFRFHDLRHTTASYLTMAGATLAEVAEALGHRTLVMARRYSHQTAEHVRGTLDRIAGKLGDG
jgi:integrase